MDKIQEWKDQWNNGDVKFVPELFELIEDLKKSVDFAYGRLNMVQDVLDEGRQMLNKNK
jgi:hypothetical protein